MNKDISIAFALFTVAQGLIWYQTNLQFFNDWAKDRPLFMSMLGVPISYVLIYASKYVVSGFDGTLWPGRLIGFSTGMVIMAVLTNLHMNEGINTKTGITLVLAFIIVMIQLYWK